MSSVIFVAALDSVDGFEAEAARGGAADFAGARQSTGRFAGGGGVVVALTGAAAFTGMAAASWIDAKLSVIAGVGAGASVEGAAGAVWVVFC